MDFIKEFENLPEDEFEVAVNRILKSAGKEEDIEYIEYKIKISNLLLNIINNMDNNSNQIDIEIDG
jgi:hypothetical protein